MMTIEEWFEIAKAIEKRLFVDRDWVFIAFERWYTTDEIAAIVLYLNKRHPDSYVDVVGPTEQCRWYTLSIMSRIPEKSLAVV